MKLTGNKYVLRLMPKKAPAPGKYIWVKPPDNYRFFLETEKMDTVQAPTPHRKELVLMKLLIVAALVLLYFFIKWFFAGRTIGFYPLYLLLCISLGYKLVKLLFEWYHYWAINTPPRRLRKTQWTVDMLTTAMPGEPYEMIENTLRAMVKVRY